MTITRLMALLACGAMLALGACTDTKRVGDPDELAALRDSLAAAQAALGDSTPAKQREAVEQAKKDLEAAQTALKARPEGSPGKSEAAEALTTLGLALTAVDDLVGASASGASGPVALASMHTTLARAQAAIDAAQVKLKAAVAAAPATDTELRGLLAQAQAALTTAQVTLVPELRSELADAQGERDTARANLAAAQARVTTLTGQLTAAQARVTTLTGDLATARKQAGDNAAEVNRLKDQLTTAQGQVDTLTDQLTAANASIDTLLGLYGHIGLDERIEPERIARNIAPLGTMGPSWTVTARTDDAGMAISSTIKDEAVPYADGNMLWGGVVSTDEFQLRGLTVRGQLHEGPDATGNLEFHGGVEGGSTDGTDNADFGVTTGDTAWQRTDARVLSSIQLDDFGYAFTMKMGGAGVIFYDMERRTAYGPSPTSGAGSAWSNQVGNDVCATADAATCDDPTSSDITAFFNNPAKDPDGDAAWHFSMVVSEEFVVHRDVIPITEDREINAQGGTDVDKAPDWMAFSDSQNRRAYRVNPDYAGVVDLGDDGALSGTGDDADTTGYANLAGEEYTDPTDFSKYKVLWLSRDIAAPDGATLLEPRRANRIANGLPADQLGVYTVKLSNYAGVDDKGTTVESDDEHRYLRYAAYGLFNFLDYSGSPWFSRMQAFHFGYDAFSDTDDNKPANWGTAATPIEATFNGKTTGWVLQNPNGNAGNISQLVRLRGDVSLTANLNEGGDGHGTISGSMKNFEFLQSGAWSKLPHGVFGHSNAATTDGVTLMRADIGADGSYAGVAKTAETANKRFGEGRYGGAFYGPRVLGDLETAGHWMLPRHIGEDSSLESCHSSRPGPSCTTFGSIIGSFGAVSEPPATE